MRIAIDNRLESLKIQEVRDFTTLRVLELSSINIRHLSQLNCVEIFSQDEAIVVDVEKFNWSSGSTITARDWIRGFQCAIESNTIIKAISSSICLKLSVIKKKLVVTSKLNVTNLLHFICIPIFSPLKENDEVSGRYKIEAQGDGWIAKPVMFDRVSSPSMYFYVIEDPYLAVQKFNQLELDKTPESCLPLNYTEFNRRYLKKIESDLFGYISFSKEFSRKISDQGKEMIFDAVTSLVFSDEFEGSWNIVKYKKSNTNENVQSVSVPKLKFSFDKVYPNKKFCEMISNHLRKKFIITELIGSDYGGSPEGWDLRFHIVHFYGLPEYWQAEFCRIAGAKYSCQKVGDDYVANSLGGELHWFPICNIPLRYLERGEWIQHDRA